MNGDLSRGPGVALLVRGSLAREPGSLPAQPRHALPQVLRTTEKRVPTWLSSAFLVLSQRREGAFMLDGLPLVDVHLHVARIPTLKPAWQDWAHDFGDTAVM